MNDEVYLRGEYWIQDGHVEFADGDVGDRNHEGIAISHVLHTFLSTVTNIAEDLEIDVSDIESYDDVDYDNFAKIMSEIIDKLQETHNTDRKQASIDLMEQIGCNSAAYQILHGGGDARLYVMKYENWIAIRENNIELYGYNEQKRGYLQHGLADILESEGIDESVPPEDISFGMHDLKTGRSSYLTLQDIENPAPIMRSNQSLQTVRQKPLSYGTNRDSEENKGQNPSKSQPSKWNVAAQNAKIIGPGQELWRGTSEGWVPFSKWLSLRESNR